MSNVEFENINTTIDNNRKTNDTAMVSFLIKTGFASDKKHANYIMIGVAILSIIVAIFIIFTQFKTEQKLPPPLMISTPR